MRLSLTVAVVAFVASVVVPGGDAGMNDWFGSMWGGGGGGGKGGGKGGGGKGRGRKQRPSGGYRPIVISAPPIYQPSPIAAPIYKEPIVQSYGYGGAGGFGKGGFGGGFGGFGGGHGGHGGGHGGHGGGGFGSFGGGSFGGGSSYGGGSFHGGSFGGGGGGFGNFNNIGNFGGSFGGHGHGKGKGISKGSKRPSYGGGAKANQIESSYSTSYGGKQPHGFGPIKDDDLIVVQEGYGYGTSNGGGGVSISGGAHGHGRGGALEIAHEGEPSITHNHDGSVTTSFVGGSSIKGSRLFDLEPPPVYHAGSGGADQLSLADHGTSSVSYLEQQPPAPLYSLERGSSSGKDDSSFQPSKQIPFPNEISISVDAEASYSAPAAVHQQTQLGSYSEAGEAVVSYDHPLDYNDPIIEIVFEDDPAYAGQGHGAGAGPISIDPALFQTQSDEVEVYFIEVSDDQSYESVDDLDLSSALQGVREEFPEGLPSELSQTLINSGYLDNAQIEVLDLASALGDNTLDSSVRHALREAYGGSESKTVATVVKAPKALESSPEKKDIELKLHRLNEDKNSVRGDLELARSLSSFRTGRYGGIVELNDKDSDKYLPLTVDGDRIPIPDHPELNGKKISGVLVYKDSTDASDANPPKTNIVVTPGASRTARRVQEDPLIPITWTESDWLPVPPFISTEKKSSS